MPGKPGSLFFHLSVLTVSAGTGGTWADDPPSIRVRDVTVEYAVNESALPLESVELWFTLDNGASWQLYGQDEDRQPPAIFHSPAEGLVGFYFVVRNSTGSSSEPPRSGTAPHASGFVDFTAPVVQLHALRESAAGGQRIVQIRWTAIDGHLQPRPIEVEYRSPQDQRWEGVCREPLANTGRYDWRLPDEVRGSVEVRIAVSDKGGNRVLSEPQPLVLASAAAPAAGGTNLPTSPKGGATGEVDDATLAGSKKAQQRIGELIEQARTYGQRGEYAEGVARLREVVRLQPSMTDAFVELGGMLHQAGDADRALQAFDIALSRQPTLRHALLGSAMALKDKGQNGPAAERLRTILRYNPNDAEIWMRLGDVAVFQGDELLARECYTRASQIDPSAGGVIAEARERLALMAKTSRQP